MPTWEYLTTPLMIHNTAAILNNWGAQGWELVQVVTGPEGGLVAYLKREEEGVPDDRGSPIVSPNWASSCRPSRSRRGLRSRRRAPAILVFTAGQLPLSSGVLAATGKVGAEVSRRGGAAARAHLRAERARRGRVA